MGQQPELSVYSIPANYNFADCLAAGLLARYAGQDDVLALARHLVLVPNRRAVRVLRDAFLRASGGTPMLLPAIRPVGDVAEDDLLMGEAENEDAAPTLFSADDALAIPPAFDAMERDLILARLVGPLIDVGEGDTAPSAIAAAMGQALGRFLDAAIAERADLSGLSALAPEDYAEHWQKVLAFLDIITAHWPSLCAEQGRIDGADRRSRLIDTLTDKWRLNPPPHGVTVAGSTGSLPAVAELMAEIAAMPGAQVVLPGLDRTLDEASYKALPSGHPQAGLKRLLDRMGLTRADVKDWPLPESASHASDDRIALLAEVMRPAETTEKWMQHKADWSADRLARALEGVQVLTAPAEREEAEAISLAMREAIEVPGKTAALITPDRALARRVAAQLQGMGLVVDDSAGVPLARTPAGQFLLLVADVLAEDFAPLALLGLLKHPLCLMGRAPAKARQLARMLDRMALRGPHPAPGLGGLELAISAVSKPPPKSLEELLTSLKAAFDQTGETGLEVLSRIAEALSRTETGEAKIWAGDDGAALAAFVRSLHGAMPNLGAPVPLADLRSFLEIMMAGQAVRQRRSNHPRLAILGPIEARMHRADLTILGGLNEGVWPRAVAADPWLSRPMRTALGLPEPERAHGLSAHDFVQAASGPEVILSRALKRDNAPAVASRWWVRFDAVIKTFSGDADACLPEGPWAAWVAALGDYGPGAPAVPPRPTPPVEARPESLSVTEVEKLVRDPYAIYAKRVLGLKPLDPLEQEPGAAERGLIIHNVLEEFIRQHSERLPKNKADALDELLELGRTMFDALADRPSVQAFWWPRFEQAASWFIDFEYDRRARMARAHVEAKGVYRFDSAMGLFTLRGRADRIDQMNDGSLEILDYKTGAPPSKKQVEAGFAPQLSLEAAMAKAGAFEGLKGAPVSGLSYVHIKGGKDGGAYRPVADNAEQLGEDALAGLQALITAYAKAEQPYLSRPHLQFRNQVGDYDYLARLGEWQGEDDG